MKIYLVNLKNKSGEKKKMPNKDGTGPQGNGSKTGRGLGNCQGRSENSNNANFIESNRRGRNCQRGQRCKKE